MEMAAELEMYKNWLKRQGLEKAPFTLEIIPSLRVGYKNQVATLLRNIEQRQKVLLLMGPTGSGKTTLINHICSTQKNYIFMGKPPRQTEDLLKIPYYFMHDAPLLTKIFANKPKEVQFIPEFLNKNVEGHKIIFIDEAHEASLEVLEWLRVISDQTHDLTIIFAALPVFDEILTKNLETLKKRVTEKIELAALSRDETEELIKRRIEYAGGKGISPFTPDAIDYIYQRTGGFPRDVLTLSNTLFNRAADTNADKIDSVVIGGVKNTQKSSYNPDKLKDLPEKQRAVIDLLLSSEPRTPTDVASHMKGYPSEKHALRAVNNLLTRMMEEGYVERKREGKTYSYVLSPQTRTKLVKA
jgi:type II secretory pathway predicted ATPase ExeA